MIYEYGKLRGKIKEVCGTQDSFSKELGIGKVSLSQRLNSRAEFSQGEILAACDILGIRREEIPVYFFTLKI